MIHDYDKMLRQSQERITKSKKLSERNKELIRGYMTECLLKNLSKPRLTRICATLKVIGERLGIDFDKATKEDLKSFIATIQQSDYSQWTKMDYKIMLRLFYKWQTGYKGKGYPEIVDWITIRLSRSQRKLPSEGDLLTEEDIKKLMSKCFNNRDKAMVSVLWESGARVSEIGNLKLKHVVFDKHGVVLTVQGKTGSRKIRLITSTPHLSTWLNTHPKGKTPDSQLWVNIGCKHHHKPMACASIRAMLQKVFKRAEITKKCNPHIFRHSRATFMAHHLTEFQMNQYFGWVQGSDMPSTYIHMSGKSVDKAILAMNGMKLNEEKEESKIQPVICTRCDTINSTETSHCIKCGGLIDIRYAWKIEEENKAQNKVNEMMRTLLEDKNMVAMLAQKMAELGVNKMG